MVHAEYDKSSSLDENMRRSQQSNLRGKQKYEILFATLSNLKIIFIVIYKIMIRI